MSQVPANNVFDFKILSFRSFFTKLPVVDGDPKIFIPRRAARANPSLGKDQYYRNFVLEFLLSEHQHPGDGLATVLKNGTVKVYIKDLKNKYPLKKDFLFNFSLDHPEVLSDYKRQLRITAGLEKDPKFKKKAKSLTLDQIEKNLSKLKPGRADAYKYQGLIYSTLIDIFGERTTRPEAEKKINKNRKRLDIVFRNSDKTGFFNNLSDRHEIKCPRIMVECKNVGSDVGNPELYQLNGRFSTRRGRFGILVCRSIEDRDTLLERCKDFMHDSSNYIIVLDDNDILGLADLREKGLEQKIDEYFEDKLDELIM